MKPRTMAMLGGAAFVGLWALGGRRSGGEKAHNAVLSWKPRLDGNLTVHADTCWVELAPATKNQLKICTLEKVFPEHKWRTADERSAPWQKKAWDDPNLNAYIEALIAAVGITPAPEGNT